MAAEFHYNDSGTWRKMKEIHFNDSGTWRKLKEVWFNDNGTWRKVFSGATVYLVNHSLFRQSAGTATVIINFNNTGSMSGTFTTNTPSFSGSEWLTGGTPGDYSVRATYYSGATASGPAYGSWWNLGTTRTWSLSTTSTNAGAFTVDIRRDSDSQTLVSGILIDLSCETIV